MARTRVGWFAILSVVVLVLAGCGSGSDTTTESSATTPTSSASTTAPSSTASTVPPSTPAIRGNAKSPDTQTVQVWFLDQIHARTGEDPLYRSVNRQVQPPAIAGGALDALFAGPTATEQADGLQLVVSGATGYRNLHIENDVAFVTLSGACSSRGSTMTIAGEIVPTLKQFASVRYVKIYAPDGTTEQPTGASDSIPECLEP